VTLSDPDIRKILNAFFVCTWKNLEGDPQAGGSPRILPGGEAAPLPRGSGYPNFQLLIFTPDARLLHAVIGAIDARDLKWALAQALITYDAVKARPRTARQVVVWRQDRIQEQIEGKQAKAKTRGFRIPSASKKRTQAGTDKPTRAYRRHAARERRILKRHPLALERQIKTHWLTEGNKSAGFAGNGKILKPPRSGKRTAAAKTPRVPQPPRPWPKMPAGLRERFAEALGVTAPPAAAKPPSKKPPTVRFR